MDASGARETWAAGRTGEQHREWIQALASEHHAHSPRVFGSVARGEDGHGSDIGILVEFTDEAVRV